jgi:hypothetical protein
MKASSKIRLFPLFVPLLVTSPLTAHAAPNETTVVDSDKGAIPFVPFTMDDLINPDTGRPYAPSDLIQIEVDGKPKFAGRADEVLAKMNEAEQHYAELGTSLRGLESDSLLEIAKNKTNIRQRLEALRLSATGLRDKVKDALQQCDLLTVRDLGINIETHVPFLKDDVVLLERGVRLTAAQLVDRLNYQQDMLCRLGYDLFEGVQRSADDALARLLARRASMLQELGIPSYHPTFDLAELGHIPDGLEMADDVRKAIEERRVPSAKTLEALAREAGGLLPPEWTIPEMPNIPSNDLPKRRDLALMKHKTWGGIDIGPKEIAAIYANAWYEVRGQEKPTIALDARGEAKAGAYVLGNEINVVHGKGIFTAEQGSGVSIDVSLKIFGDDAFEPIVKSDPASYTKSDPRAFHIEKNLPPYEAQFAIGPIPVTVKAQFRGEMYIGYEVGLDLEGVHGKVIPGAVANLHVEAGAGVSGLSAGASGDVVLLDGSVPIYGGAALKSEDGSPYLSLSVYGDTQYRYLDGHISAYAEYPWFRCKSLTKCGFTTKRAERELFAWTGGGETTRFFNWGMDLRPYGVKMRGDLIDQTDREELAALEEAATLEQRKLDTAKAEHEVVEKERRAVTAMIADLGSEATARVVSERDKYERAHGELKRAVRDLVALAAGRQL